MPSPTAVVYFTSFHAAPVGGQRPLQGIHCADVAPSRRDRGALLTCRVWFFRLSSFHASRWPSLQSRWTPERHHWHQAQLPDHLQRSSPETPCAS